MLKESLILFHGNLCVHTGNAACMLVAPNQRPCVNARGIREILSERRLWLCIRHMKALSGFSGSSSDLDCAALYLP